MLQKHIHNFTDRVIAALIFPFTYPDYWNFNRNNRESLITKKTASYWYSERPLKVL